MFKIIPVFLYALGEHPLSKENLEELRNLKETYPYSPVLFVSALTTVNFDSLDGELTRSEQHGLQTKVESSSSSSPKEDSTRSNSVQSHFARPTSMRLNSVYENENQHELDPDDSLGAMWLDQLTNLGFMGESEIDQTSWLSNEQYTNANSDLVDSCKKLGNGVNYIKFL